MEDGNGYKMNDLAPCPACGKSVSVMSVACVHCGRPKPYKPTGMPGKKIPCSCTVEDGIVRFEGAAYRKCPSYQGKKYVIPDPVWVVNNDLLDLCY